MRALLALVFAGSVGGCSFLDQLELNGPPKLDPNKIYLGTSIIDVSRHDLDRYACVNGPVMCRQFGVTYECSCPQF